MTTSGRPPRPATVNELLELALFHLSCLAVAQLPERVKVRPPWREYSTTSAHAVSGLAEALGGVALFATGLLSFARSFSRGPGYTYLAHQPTLHHGDFLAMGALGYLSFVLHPLGMVSIFLLAEGVVRSLAAALTGGRPGLAVLSVPHWVFLRLQRLAASVRLDNALGPPRPDVVLLPDVTPDGSLVIVSRDRKDWSDVQVVELDGRFYRLVDLALVRDGRLHSWRYRFRGLDPAEIIRGTVVHLEAPRPPRSLRAEEPATPGEPPRTLTGRLTRRR